MKRLNTLRVRFGLWVALLLLAALGGFGVFVYASLARGLASAMDDSLRLNATQAVTAVDVENGKIDVTESFPESEAAELVERGLTIRILNLQGEVLQAVGPYRAVPVNSRLLDEARQGRASFETVLDSQAGDSVRMFTAPIIRDAQRVGIVQVAQSLDPVEDTLDRLLAALLLATPLLVGLAGLGGYFLAARALAPIDAMTHTARRISAEDLSARLNLPATDDEVGRLARTFDDMLARLDESFRRERRFTADASHELRTPLTAMQAILGVIRQERRSPEDYEQALDDLAEEAERLRALTEDLLLLARGDLREPALREPVDLSALLRDVNDSLQPLAEEKGLTLRCTIPEDLTLSGDRDGLVRLFVNLLDNAIRYTEHGEITTTALREGDGKIQVSIVDTGRGIPAEHLPHIFDRFYRVEKSRSTNGSGLGLAIALDIAKAHGGRIQVSSQVGSGSTFRVELDGRD